MTGQRPRLAEADTLFTKAGRLLAAAWMVGVLASYLQLLVARILRVAGALP
jgi:hypothetical protein